MTRLIFALMISAIPVSAAASDAHGLWKTEADDKGAYIYVTLEACSSNTALTCGVISDAFTAAGKDSGYANLGKPIVKDMASDSASSYSGGTIWDPQKNKTYKSKMSLSGNTLTVKGCIGPICIGQKWTRVK